MAICKIPAIKNEEKHSEFFGKIQQGKYDTEAEKAAYFSDPSDFLWDIAVATDDYLHMYSDKNLRWPLREPYVSMFLADYQFNGYCVEVSLESIRQEMIKSGKINGNDKDSRFTAALWLKVLEYFISHLQIHIAMAS